MIVPSAYWPLSACTPTLLTHSARHLHWKSSA